MRRYMRPGGDSPAANASSGLASVAHAREVESDQVRFLYALLPPSLCATAVIGGLLGYVLWAQVPRPLLLAWLVALVLLTLGRLWLMQRYFDRKPPPDEARRWGNRFLVGVGLSGLLWGLAGILPFRETNLVHEMFLGFVLAGLSAGATTTLSSFRGGFEAFLVPAAIPYTVRVLLQEGDVYVAMGGMLLLFIALMSMISRRHYRALAESLRLHYQNLDLLNDLGAATDHQQLFNQQLVAEIQERLRAERALQASNELYRNLVDTTCTGYLITDVEGKVLDANPIYVRLTGHQLLGEIRGRCVSEWTAPHDLERNAGEIGKCVALGYVRDLEIDYQDAAGRITPIEINANVVTSDGRACILALTRDITARRKAERALRQAHDELEVKVGERTAQLARATQVLQTEKELFRVTLASIGDAVITTDASAQITYLNAVAERLTGWTDAAARGRPLIEVFRTIDEETREPAEDPIVRCLGDDESAWPRGDHLLLGAARHEISIDMSVAPIRDDRNSIIGGVLVFRDVSVQRKLAQQLSHQATHDSLTDLVNRHEFERRLANLLASANPFTAHAVLYLDLDQFKVVNDTCGHVAGDDLLRQVAALLRAKLRARDTLARLGGDEFGVLLEHCSIVEAKRIAGTLRELLQAFRFGWQDKSFTISVSIGLVPIAHAGETVSSVLSAADSACYAAKDEGRNRIHVYWADDSILARREGEMRWMPRIQQALADDRFRLYFQPIVPVGQRQPSVWHGEILLRMLDEQGRIVPPGAFLPAAERYGLMLSIDRWVVGRSLEALAAMTRSGADAAFSINLSGQSFGVSDFLDFVVETINRTHVSPSRLCFEITESSAVSELAHVLHFIHTLREFGCRFALDDFGTGLSSFSYLKTLPVHCLKIAGGFVRGLAVDETDRAMVEAVHRIGHVMGLTTVAECVESLEIMEKLREIGIDYGQGFALGEPRPLPIH
jgi:diguanylate cyclase (GGDEF)-like protein/PAS domain S-box-containing protein